MMDSRSAHYPLYPCGSRPAILSGGLVCHRRVSPGRYRPPPPKRWASKA